MDSKLSEQSEMSGRGVERRTIVKWFAKNSNVRAQRESSQNSRERGRERRRKRGGDGRCQDDENHGGSSLLPTTMFWKEFDLHIAQKLLTTTPSS